MGWEGDQSSKWSEQRLASVALLTGGSRAEVPREHLSLYLYSQVPPRSFIDRGAVTAIYRRCKFTAGAREISAPIAIPSLRFSYVILLSFSSTMDVRSRRLSEFRLTGSTF